MFRSLISYLALFLCIALFPSVCRANDPLYTEVGAVAPFELTDQKGRTITLDDLRGQVWVASFFFSTCTECNKTTIQQLDRMQKDLAGWPDVKLVSFTVYPERDTPEQLARFAEQIGVNPNRWLLLTGTEDELFPLIRKSFVQTVEPNPDGGEGNKMVHSFQFMIVDQHGKIRGYIRNGKDATEVDQLENRVKELVQAKYLPTVNAFLNGTCALLLIFGYVTIRRRWITLHKVCMLSALVVSALFLTCYLYYHLVIQHGQPTYFTGEGWVRGLYLGILLSHTILAVVATPLALISAYWGLRNRLARHVVLARWTLPIWLYVSVTGVVVYVMLYHLYPPA